MLTEPTNRRAGCGKTARPVRREGWPSGHPYPYRACGRHSPFGVASPPWPANDHETDFLTRPAGCARVPMILVRSGLVRKGLVWGQLWHGLRTLNGKPIRDAVALWWNDCSALALRDGHRGWTVELFRQASVGATDHARLRPGDLAVTAGGSHVMAYLGQRTWIEADPGAGQVIEVVLPTENPWFKTPVVFVRWKWLSVSQSPPRPVVVVRDSADVRTAEFRTHEARRASRGLRFLSPCASDSCGPGTVPFSSERA